MLKPWMGWCGVLVGAVLVVAGVAHASHWTQALVGLGVVVGVAGYEVARGKITV